ncbi:MAG: PD-(D/E)XK nuclease family protein [Bacteroidetes bacterium]|nr:PD-(D/E)XK nuclease family protein [Bacteroidota bacterium]
MQHPYTRMLAAPEMNQVSFVAAVSAAFASTNRVFFTRDDILALSDFVAGCFSSVFPEIVPRTGQVIAICSEMFASIISNSKETADSIELGFLSSCVSMFNQFRSFFEQYQPDWNVSFFRKVLTTTMQGVRVPFSGEPLEGLQIMGMLESRGLDFENVILLSANEGILPTGKAHNSFIPLDIRQEFGLPAYREKDAIFAYHFYRLIQRAQKAFILYNTDISDGMKTGEKSRFITQILHELPRYNKDISIKESFIHAFPGEIGGTRIEEVAKTPEILAKINQIEQKGYSPTSLSTYLRCNLRFYYSYILGIQEVAEIEETMDAATVGTIVHQVLETLYGSFGNTALTAAALRDAKKGISEQIESAIAEHYPGGDIAFGKNLLLRKIAEKALREFLEAEATYIEDTKATIEIRELERKLIAALQVGDVQVNIRGTVDRIDACNGNIRILDYKTGKVDPLSLKVSSITPEKKIEDFEKAFQLMVYCWMFDKTDNTQASAGIISFRNPSKYVLPLLTDTPGNRVTPESLDSLEQMLFELVSEIRNPSQPFLPTTESRRCSYCPYTALCGLVGTT